MGSLIYSSIIFCPIGGGVCLIVYGKGKDETISLDNLVTNITDIVRPANVMCKMYVSW